MLRFTEMRPLCLACLDGRKDVEDGIHSAEAEHLMDHDDVVMVEPIVIIEPADYETSFPLDEPNSESSPLAQRIAFGIGLQRVQRDAAWTSANPFLVDGGDMYRFSDWYRDSLIYSVPAYRA